MPRKNPPGLTPKALNRALKTSLPYTRKLRSSAPMDNDPDTVRIRARLANGCTPQEIAEEGYRVCRINAALRTELAKARKEAKEAKEASAVPTLTHSTPANTAGTVPTIIDAADTPIQKTTDTGIPYRVVPIIQPDNDNDIDMTGTIPIPYGTLPAATDPQADPQPTMKALKNKIAITQDALSELRAETVSMRTCMAWMWEIISRRARDHVPRELRDMYHETMVVDLVDWMPKNASTSTSKRKRKRFGGRQGMEKGREEGEEKEGGKEDTQASEEDTQGSEEGEVKEMEGLEADNVVVGGKRRGVDSAGGDRKKMKRRE